MYFFVFFLLILILAILDLIGIVLFLFVLEFLKLFLHLLINFLAVHFHSFNFSFLNFFLSLYLLKLWLFYFGPIICFFIIISDSNFLKAFYKLLKREISWIWRYLFKYGHNSLLRNDFFLFSLYLHHRKTKVF